MIQAAGAVVWVDEDEGSSAAVLLVHRPKYDDWSLPKGKLDPGESWQEAAVREVAEEAGVDGELGRELIGTAYRAPAGPKAVRYWEMQVAGRGVTDSFVPNDEVDELRWVPLGVARAMVRQAADRVVLDSFASTCRRSATLER